MKKTTLHLLMLMFLSLITAPETTAQNDPVLHETGKSFMIGLNFGRMVSDTRTSSYFRLDNKNYLSSYTFGISSSLQLTDFIDIKAGIQHERKGIVFPENIGFFLSKQESRSLRLHYLTIHQSILFSTRGRTAFYIGPGIYQAFLLQANHFLFSDQNDHAWTGTPGFDFGPILHTGISSQLTPTLRAHLEITATMGLTSIYEKELEQWFPPAINRSISSRIAFTYSLQ